MDLTTLTVDEHVALHRTYAAAWVRYNSLSGRSTVKRENAVMLQLTLSDLARMLAARGIVPIPSV